jgi:protein-L-isoaspartate(D-aspartate) O-methyltransferase
MIPDWRWERHRMVEQQLRRRGIRDERVLEAMGTIPREEFVPAEVRLCAYQDGPLHIGYGQTISQPYMIALMAEMLELKGTERVLEVGTGCGYHAAVLAKLTAEVVTVELIPGLARTAEQNLARTGLGGNVRVICGDASAGWKEASPYEGISVEAGAPEIPAALLEQLTDPGRLVIPVGDVTDQELLVIEKVSGKLVEHGGCYCRFVPLRGGEGWQ